MSQEDRPWRLAQRCVLWTFDVTTEQIISNCSARAIICRTEECGDDHVANETNLLQSFVCQLQLFMFFLRRYEITALENSLSISRCAADAAFDLVLAKGPFLFGQPVKVGNLLACQADERVTRANRVIDKRERMILGQRRQP